MVCIVPTFSPLSCLLEPGLWGNSSETNWALKLTSSLETNMRLGGGETTDVTLIKSDMSQAELEPIELLTGNPCSLARGWQGKHEGVR